MHIRRAQCLMVGIVSNLDTDKSCTMSLCTIKKPFVWYRVEGTGSASVAWLDESSDKTWMEGVCHKKVRHHAAG